MQLRYAKKRDIRSILRDTPLAVLRPDLLSTGLSKNLLVKGENTFVMQTLLQKYKMHGKVDLVYIDPPFATNNTFRQADERTSTISPSNSDQVAYTDTLTGHEYLEFLRERLALLRELMSHHASIYLHIDYKIGHYVKVIMDEVFGDKNFRNDITRIKCNPKNFAQNGYGNIKDMVLFYTKTDDFYWNDPRIEFTEAEVTRLFPKTDSSGRRYTTTPLHGPGETRNGNTGKEWKGMKPPRGRHWRYDPSVLDQLDADGLIEWSKTGNPRKIIYADEIAAKGKRLQDIWEFKDPQYPGYPTEKNKQLLDTIISASSEPGHTVLDCFCGSGTTLIAAEDLGRNWIGIDKSDRAIAVARQRIEPKFTGLFSHQEGYAYLEQVDTAPSPFGRSSKCTTSARVPVSK